MLLMHHITEVPTTERPSNSDIVRRSTAQVYQLHITIRRKPLILGPLNIMNGSSGSTQSSRDPVTWKKCWNRPVTTSHDKQLPLKAKRDRLWKEQTTLRTNEY